MLKLGKIILLMGREIVMDNRENKIKKKLQKYVKFTLKKVSIQMK